MRKFEVYRRVLPSVGPIIFRNVFVVVNVVLLFVVILLFIFGNFQAGLFLGIVLFLNTFISITQDIHARVLLERLQMLTALRVLRINKDPRQGGAGNTESILAEEIKKGDLLQLELGDQMPCEGILVSSDNLEISEALVTGESDSFPKKEGDKIIAGAIITSGHGVVEAEGLFRDSRLSIIAGEVKKYASNPSSIQTGINTVIKYSGYTLLVVLLFVVVRGTILNRPRLEIVTNAGALASALVPQGLMVVITLLFAIGAANYSRRNVLFQEINATEKLGRIKNLCIDKTGTLTDNILVVENMHIVGGYSEEHAHALAYACVFDVRDSSQTIVAVKKYLEKNIKSNEKKMDIVKVLPFSSWRRYSAIELSDEGVKQSVFVGSPDIMLPRISNTGEKNWLENIITENARVGKRVLCFASALGVELPKEIGAVDLSIVAIFVFHNTLRQGIEDAIKFFQDRKMRIRVLSGDNADTVQAVAERVGINGAENVITGKEMEKWSDSDYAIHAHEYTIFAQILPEHKVKLVKALKKDGFTAMVGDGVNDALAMKESDLGIAMFDGVPVTRQLADVVLMTNSFSDLPGAVEVADHFIRSIEINSGVYINMSFVGLFFFIIISIFGYSFPLMPLNITFINYFTVGFSGILISYWALRPSHKILPSDDRPFMKRIMPFAFYCAIVEAVGTALVFMLSPHYLKIAPSNTLVGLAVILFGFLFLILAANVYCGTLTKKEKLQLFLLGIFQAVVLGLALQIPLLIHFFSITLPFPPPIFIMESLLVVMLCFGAQYLMMKEFFLKPRP